MNWSNDYLNHRAQAPQRRETIDNIELLEHIATRFKLMGEPMRLKILAALRNEEKCVKELVEETGTGQANISKHLSLLALNGILERRKQGLHVYYYIADGTTMEIYDLMVERLGVPENNI